MARHRADDKIAYLPPAARLSVGIGKMNRAVKPRKAGNKHGVAGREHRRHEGHGHHDGAYARGPADNAAEAPAQPDHEARPEKIHNSPSGLSVARRAECRLIAVN